MEEVLKGRADDGIISKLSPVNISENDISLFSYRIESVRAIITPKIIK